MAAGWVDRASTITRQRKAPVSEIGWTEKGLRSSVGIGIFIEDLEKGAGTLTEDETLYFVQLIRRQIDESRM